MTETDLGHGRVPRAPVTGAAPGNGPAGHGDDGPPDTRLLRLDGVVKTFRRYGAEVRALDGVSLSLGKGERLGVIGESGSGKSTAANLVLGVERCDGGSVEVLGRGMTAGLSRRDLTALRGRIGTVFQEPVESLNPRISVGRAIAEPLLVHRRELSRSEVDGRVEEAVELVGLGSAYLTRRPRTLSGGEAQRVAIARAIVNEPELLVLDEPTSALDVSVQAEIVGVLLDLAESTELGWLFITHNLHTAGAVSDRVAVLRHGRIVEEGPAARILGSPEAEYTKELVGAAASL